MRQFLPASVIALLFTVMTACSSAPPKPVVDFDPEHDFSGDRTFAFYALSGRTSGDNPMQLTDFQRERINKALANALELKGFTEAANPADADFLVSWHLNAVEKQDVRSTSSPNFGMSVGYSRYNRYAMYSCYSCFQSNDVRVVDYTQGTFIVDMIEPARNQSVWRSVTQSKLKGEGLRDQATIDRAALLVLGGFPPTGN